MTRMETIKAQVKKVPETPGVYLMKDKWGNVIYVGKAKRLKQRVSSYFRALNSHAPKVRSMVAVVEEFEYILTDSEMEALILEQTLIKQYKPKFNILLRDDKQYPYIKVTVDEPFPRLIMTRQLSRDKARYFGPYTSAEAVRRTIEALQEIYPIRKCNRRLEKMDERPCLNFHIRKCLGPCQGTVHQAEYRAMIEEILKFLGGKTDFLKEKLTAEMKTAAAALEFEKAAALRNQVMAIDQLMERQKVVYESDVSQDVIGSFATENRICIMIFTVRGGKMIGKEEYVFEEEYLQDPDALLDDFILQYYANVTEFPKEIVVERLPEDFELLEAFLAKKASFKIKLTAPQRGDKIKLLDLVRENAREYLEKFEERILREREKSDQIETALREMLGLKGRIRRIEAYDISNIYGVLSVGSMVVYEDGKKKPRDYRRFKVKTIEGANDYGSMQEILFRRFRRGLEEQAAFDALVEAQDAGEALAAEDDTWEGSVVGVGLDRSALTGEEDVFEVGEEAAAAAIVAAESPATYIGKAGRRWGAGSSANAKFSQFPDLILIDGGKGHVSAVLEVMNALGLELEIAGLVKDDYHRTDQLYYRGQFYAIRTQPELYRFLAGIQEEVHRFALEYHKTLRSKNMTQSLLDEIEGVGEKRRLKLMQYFKSIDKIREASVEELAKVDGMNRRTAEKVYDYFHGTSEPQVTEEN
ncbi:excinuclease ABC subunit UvrC [Acidaminobacter sp.]|uniref:excinuclease ABC subunit UvrC n=1 Tax=Acidaminobacter sp. TaxID=1872102 RepID=UPI00137FF328|nr:excinuclease ABC subunit UvrC [Acidaminobacter sp.]MDK9710853.1 excinuclease ABC subunit UvrC [Acidaminobacter sp.]MZQ98316.1 excinuclease ABC subunit UvrC [Acidaminobacter sp.]